jgi:hypothetical protein
VYEIRPVKLVRNDSFYFNRVRVTLRMSAAVSWCKISGNCQIGFSDGSNTSVLSLYFTISVKKKKSPEHYFNDFYGKKVLHLGDFEGTISVLN